jgi:5-methylcytosine-specific restriction endonuclease McrA
MAKGDPRSTRAWRKLRDQVVAEEPMCWLRLVGCTYVSTTADHVIPVVERPDLAMVRDNLRGACKACNSRRQDRPLSALAGRSTIETPALEFFL